MNYKPIENILSLWRRENLRYTNWVEFVSPDLTFITLTPSSLLLFIKLASQNFQDSLLLLHQNNCFLLQEALMLPG